MATSIRTLEMTVQNYGMEFDMRHKILKQHYQDRPLQKKTACRVIECWACGGTGWKEATIDDATLIGNGGWCIRCSGTGRVWVDFTP
jgi:hypothetical protein